jgi:hypothetical protein
MFARIVGFVDVDKFVTPAESEALLRLEYFENYSAFVFGGWRNCVLFNGSGAAADCDLHEYEGDGRPTANLVRVPGVRALVEACFIPKRLKWVRLFLQDKGVLLPHTDFAGMRDGFLRLHIPLRTSARALHSEEDEVYHMDVGEIWQLEALRVHSAGNFSSVPRVSLCADFEPGVPVVSVVTDEARNAAAARQPQMIERPPLTEEDRHLFDDLVPLLRKGETGKVLERLIGLHFSREVPASAVFGWLDDLAASIGEPAIMQRARDTRKLALGR